MDTPRRARLAPILALVLTLGCDSANDAVKSGEQAARDASQQALDASKQKAGELADGALDASKKAAGDLASAAQSGATALFSDLRHDGELSNTAKRWLKDRSGDSTIETILAKGVQLAPVALEATKTLADATDSDTVVEPIFQRIEDDPAKVDAAIGDMPRVEVVDDVTVGFKQLDGIAGTQHVKERGYLVMWRHEQHLVGFVYRSTRTIDLEKLVEQTPRLIRLTQAALRD